MPQKTILALSALATAFEQCASSLRSSIDDLGASPTPAPDAANTPALSGKKGTKATKPAFTEEQVREKLTEVIQKKGRDKAVELIKEAGADKLGEVTPENYAGLMKAAGAALLETPEDDI